MSPTRVVLCIDGGSPEALLERALPLVDPAAVWVPTHVVDVRPRQALGFLRGGVVGAGPLSRGQQQALDAATAEHTRSVLDAATSSLQRRGLAYAPPQIRTGEPGRELCGVAAFLRAELMVLFASRRPRPPVGPGSVGHTARFVVDHAPCPVLVIREAH